MTLVTIQLSKQESLNGICDIAKAMEYEWNRAGLNFRIATPRFNTRKRVYGSACVRRYPCCGQGLS